MLIVIKTKSKLYSYNYNFRLKTISIIKFEKKMLTEENDVHLAAPLVSMTNKQTIFTAFDAITHHNKVYF